MSQDPTREGQFVEFRKAFQQISARTESMAELAQRLTPSDEQQQEQMSKLQMKMQEHQLKMQIMSEQHQAKMMLKTQDVQNRASLRKFQTDTKLAMELSRPRK
jgi:two-component sensor histidine kinase